MPTSEDFLGSYVEDSGNDGDNFLDISSGNTEVTSSVSWSEPGYIGAIDYRVRQLSYSSLLTLHSCPRKYQLYKLRTTHRAEESFKSSITFAFGHFVGEAIQLALQDLSYEEILWKQFLSWPVDILAEDEKLKKSFWSATMALKRFISIRADGGLAGYELVSIDGKPACELSFCILFPDGFRYRGHVDAVLQHRTTGKVIVLELKTTGMSTTNPSKYKNSAQAIGYSIVLDHIFPSLSSYEVLYLEYNTKSGEYTPIPFTKTFLQRALWIRELLLDIETIKAYEEAEIYPMRGESCTSWGRDCEYINSCTLSTQFLTTPCTPDQEDKTEYQVVITLADLIESQMKKAQV